ncbi:dihydroorotate dehydrogenase electron transfer subunit [Candidatus Peregrinibacteria bacterium]|nr:dihydroorotate dehydrogenase electron transfer subunit [Candidatus Peregrinibacteria bacterium]
MNIKKFDSRFQILPIAKIIQENATTRTFVFEHNLGGRPGQFLMMWIPGVDEKPMSIAFADEKEFWVTVCAVGDFSQKLHTLHVGDKVGVRGPLGTHYKFRAGEHLALVAGGYGAAPMYFVAHEAVKIGCKVEFLSGARNKDLLLYSEKVLGLGVNLHISTDDGSAGFKGYVTQLLDQIMAAHPARHGGRLLQSTSRLSETLASSAQKIDQVFACGPEVMMKAAGQVAEKHGVDAHMSMEKYMKCGIGVCGQCAIDDSGDLCCLKGPVMSWGYLKKLPEMGQYHRDAQGRKHYFFKPLAK